MESNLKASDFAKHLNEKFIIDFGSGEAVDILLTEVHETSSRTFSIVFHLNKPNHAPQGIYTIRHEKLGKMDLFLVPVGPDNFEAVFNYAD